MALLFLPGLLWAVPVQATGWNVAGQRLAATCVTCHGNAGAASAAQFASLNGWKKSKMLARLRHYRNAQDKSNVMTQLANGYSAAELELIADYFARQPRPQE